MYVHRDVVLSLTSVHSIEIAIEVSEFYAVNDLVASWVELGEPFNIIDVICKNSNKLSLTLL